MEMLRRQADSGSRVYIYLITLRPDLKVISEKYHEMPMSDADASRTRCNISTRRRLCPGRKEHVTEGALFTESARQCGVLQDRQTRVTRRTADALQFSKAAHRGEYSDATRGEPDPMQLW